MNLSKKKIIPQKKNSDIIMKRRDSGITRRQRLITAQHSHIRVHSWLKYIAPVGVQVAAIACRAGGIGGHGGTFFPPPDFGRSINPVLTRGNRLSPPHYNLPPSDFRPSASSGIDKSHKKSIFVLQSEPL